MRIDLFLVEKGFYKTRAKAQQALEMKRVTVNGKIITKPSFSVEENSVIVALPFEFVSRGGFKLQKALEEFGISLQDRVVLDVGASTGGFSDVCLQAGAKKVFAIDIGTDQLDEKIRSNPKVVCFEQTNFLDFEPNEEISFVCIDVSFVSLTHLAEKLSKMPHIEVVALIKPQFECGAEYSRKHKGVVKDEKVRQKAINDVKTCFEKLGFQILGIIKSPILGGDGNVEYLAHMKNF